MKKKSLLNQEKMRRNKAQLTIFILIGLVFLIAGSILIATKKQVDSAHTITNYKQTQSLADLSDQLNKFVLSCLDEATDESLKLVGMQGGAVYKFQTGDNVGVAYYGPDDFLEEKFGDRVVPYYDNKSDTFYYLTYHIDFDESDQSEKYKENKLIPLRNEDFGDYPFSKTPRSIYSVAGDNFFLPALCLTGGENNISLVGGEYSCGSYYKNIKNAVIQEYLRSLIRTKALSCIGDNIYDLNDLFVFSEVGLSNAKVNIFLGENDVEVTLHLSIKFSIKGTDTKKDFESFKVTNPTRFKYIYELAYNILDKEGKNLYFDMNKLPSYISGCYNYDPSTGKRSTPVNCLRDGLSVRFMPYACLEQSKKYGLDLCNEKGNHASFLIIEDNLSRKISNKPYRFILAIADRPPILDRITYESKINGLSNEDSIYAQYLKDYYSSLGIAGDVTPNNIYNNTHFPITNSNFNIVLDYGKMLYLLPYAMDPDDINTTYLTIGGKKIPIFKGDYLFTDYSGLINPNNKISLMDTQEITKDIEKNLTKKDVGEHSLYLSVTDGLYTYSQHLKIKVRCYSYNHSADYVNYVDTNNSNDCCNETGNYHWITENLHYKCGTCHRCFEDGECLFNSSLGNGDNDCGACHSCSETAANFCAINNSVTNGCSFSNSICCSGICYNKEAPAPLSAFLTNYENPTFKFYNLQGINNSYSECWDSSPACVNISLLNDEIKNHLINKLSYKVNYSYNPYESMAGCNKGLPSS